MNIRPRLSMYGAASCGGCEIALVNLHDKILDVDSHFELFFCPVLVDTKEEQVEALPDGSIAITLFNGAIRNDDNERMAKLMRRKSALLIAFGSCSGEGCIPALGNLYSIEDHFETVYPSGGQPAGETLVPEGRLRLPVLQERVRTLSQVVEVDYSIPGCPPEPAQIWAVMEAVIRGRELPAKGSVIGAGRSSVCEECVRTKEDKRIGALHRPHEIVTDPERCLLEQGLLCMGVATRDGCGALCPRVNMPCTGCYGPPEGVCDQGAKMVAALGSVLDIGGFDGLDERQVAERVDAHLGSLPDPAGAFYKYSLAGSLLGGSQR